jgi:Flp pilus assembly protein TadD
MATLSVSGTLPSFGHQSARTLLRCGKYGEAAEKLEAIVADDPTDAEAIRLLADAYFQQRNWQRAHALAQQLIQLRPEVAEYRKLMIATLSNSKRYDDAIKDASAFGARYGDDVEVLNILKIAHFYKGDIASAVRCGQRVMELRDIEVCQRAATKETIKATAQSGRDVIAFTLWGDKPIYNYGAMINLLQAKTAYPGWACRFYIDDSAHPTTVDFLTRNGAEVVTASSMPGYFRRFLVLNEPGIRRFLIRDCDSRLISAEADLVAEWIASGHLFHIIRDHVLHNDLILAGLWGGHANCGIDVHDMLRRYFTFGPTNKYGHDQHMLATMLWPIVRPHCLVHDKFYRLPGVHTVPLTADSHFGAGKQSAASVTEEAGRYGLPLLHYPHR